MFRSRPNIDIKKEDLRGNRLPLLSKNRSWLDTFSQMEDRELQASRKRLDDLNQEYLGLDREEAGLKGQKEGLLKRIIEASDAINSKNKKEDLELLDDYRLELARVNTSLDELEARRESLPEQLEAENITLLNLTLSVGYKELQARERELELLGEELEGLQARLEELSGLKASSERSIDDIYGLMHRLVGNKIIEELDRRVLKE